MKEGNTTAMLEQLRLREVALNSIFAKTGQKIRVKAVKVHKNNNERVGLEVRDKELPIVLTYYPTADDMMQPDVRLIERIVDVLREERDEVGLIVHEPDRDEFTANLVPEVMSVENAKWLEADGRPCKIVLDMVVTLRCLWRVDMLADSEKIASCLVTKQVLDRYSLSESEAFAIAMQNLEKSAEIVPIRQVVEELLGHEVPENDYEPDMYIVSNRLRTNGAPLLLLRCTAGGALVVLQDGLIVCRFVGYRLVPCILHLHSLLVRNLLGQPFVTGFSQMVGAVVGIRVKVLAASVAHG